MSEGGKWEVVKPVAKHHPRKDKERKKAAQLKQEETVLYAQQQQQVMTPALAQALAPREKGLAKPNERGTFSVGQGVVCFFFFLCF